MRMLSWNLVLAFAWVALTGISLANFVVGFAIAYAVLWFSPGLREATTYFRKLPRAFAFAGFFLKGLAVATARITYDVLTPTPYMTPMVVGIPLELRTDLELALLSIVVTLTPGTLALDISSDRRTLYVHAMYASHPDEVRKEIKRGFERRVLELLR